MTGKVIMDPGCGLSEDGFGCKCGMGMGLHIPTFGLLPNLVDYEWQCKRMQRKRLLDREPIIGDIVRLVIDNWYHFSCRIKWMRSNNELIMGKYICYHYEQMSSPQGTAYKKRVAEIDSYWKDNPITRSIDFRRCNIHSINS